MVLMRSVVVPVIITVVKSINGRVMSIKVHSTMLGACPVITCVMVERWIDMRILNNFFSSKRSWS